MITLYDYQNDLVNEVRGRMASGHKHIIVQSPTGSGKTVVFSFIVSEMMKKGKRALILTDRIELLTETGGTLDDFNIHFKAITAGAKNVDKDSASCFIAMAQTLKNRIKKESWTAFFRSFDLVIIDEAHKQEFNRFFEVPNLFNGAYILGFTATPARSGKQRQLASDYTTMVKGVTVVELIRRGRLVKDRYFGFDVDVRGVSVDKKTGDFNDGEMFDRFNRPELYAGVVDGWRKFANNTITLVFCVNIQHVIKTCEEFNNAGIVANFVTSDVVRPDASENGTDADIVKYNRDLLRFEQYAEAFKKWSGDRHEVITSWKRGDFKVLINAGILTTGFNFKPLQTVIVNRATMADPLWLQMIGRGSRPSDGKEFFNLLDFGGNGGQGGGRLGNYRDTRVYSLIHEVPKGGGAAPVKVCGVQKRPGMKPDKTTGFTIDKNGRAGCGSYIHTSKMICEYCGYEYDTERELIAAEMKLIKYDIIPKTNDVLVGANEYVKFEQIAESRGYKIGWVYRQIAAKDGYNGLSKYAKAKGYSAGWAFRTAKKIGIVKNC